MRILTAQDIRAAVTMRDVIDAVREGFIQLSAGRAISPVRGVIPVNNGFTLTMPAYLEGSPISTVKIVSVYGDNPQKNLPTVVAKVLALDAHTGVPVALIDGTLLTALRTGAASGLATDMLARSDSSVLAVMGAGAQARTQVEAICTVRPIQEIRIFSVEGAEKMADELREKYGLKVWAARSEQEALDGADVVAAATNSKTPVVHGDLLKPGAHVNGIGSFTPEMQEIDASVVTRAKVVVDHRESAWAEAGDLIIPRDQGLFQEQDVYAEIGEIAAGDKPGRTSDMEITFFKSVGNAVQDAATARRIVEVAQARGIGIEIEV
ncbi:MAG: ornithine cyclodeaminase [Anaerolineae bacterium]|nr:ornithine cyclodeaminase [Anaerolineae bacterium]